MEIIDFTTGIKSGNYERKNIGTTKWNELRF